MKSLYMRYKIKKLLTKKHDLECGIINWRRFQETGVPATKRYDFDTLEVMLKSDLEGINKELESICGKGYSIEKEEGPEAAKPINHFGLYNVKFPNGKTYRIRISMWTPQPHPKNGKAKECYISPRLKDT